MNIVQQFTNSLWNFRSYKELSRIRGGRSFVYILLLFLVIYVIGSANIAFMTNDFVKSAQAAMQDNVPDFRLSNGKFSFDGPMPFKFEEDGFAFIIDTTGETTAESLEGTLNAILITEDDMTVIDSGRVETTPFSMLPFEISRDQIISFLPGINTIVIVVMIIWFFFAFAGKLFGILMLTLIAMIATSIYNQRLTFANQWNIAIYASTLPMIVKMLNSLAGSVLGGFMFFIYWALAITYVFVAIYYISKDTEVPVILDQPGSVEPQP